MSSLKVLISAYACRPGEGSEPGVGWNIVRELVKYHKVWVLTRENNRPGIEAELKKNPLPGIEFIYCEPSALVQKLNRNQRLVYLHYYLWQISAYFISRKLHQQIGFDLVHHVTYVRYAAPSFLALLPIPFVWGPVGGGEVAPLAFRKDFSSSGKRYEMIRDIVRNIGELDPFVRLTAQRSILARATTEDTAQRLRKLGATQVEVISQLGLSQEEITQLGEAAQIERNLIRFVSIGRLLHWKGFHLGLQAFAQANLPKNTEYWIIGDGSEIQRLETLVETLGIQTQVKFWNKLSRQDTLDKLKQCVALVHPSLHESGGLVCLEAMAAGCPVICLNLGGPALQVTEETGFKISAETPEQAIEGLASAMKTLAENSELRMQMAKAGQERVQKEFSWDIKGQKLAQLYEEIIS
ncbi:glycosyltransferase family 4 protein [Lyngbya sp. PCC 8106]|uniref:glycosyltransferase family 4 protein n=1 Tax=Lyngbya sp. (strain PCC 8106) TaxID=313612 RepID=UPI0000EACE03|nr:glycosyltransferase [Lyngbya sp. PCC 8106]EAW35501.1 putative glycosyltransferase protein [Lyngbya sp. PCC 8106]